MAKYFLTGGLAGPWKKRKVDTLKATYIPATVTQDADTHEISISMDITYDDLVDLYDKNKNIVVEANLEWMEIYIYMPLVVRAKSSFAFGAPVDFSSSETATPQLIIAAITDDDNTYVRVDSLAPAQS